MFVTDFEFDGKLLSEFGYMIGFSEKSDEAISNGSNITLHTTPFQNGMRYYNTTSTYDECLTATFGIYKNPCVFDNDLMFSMEEIRELMRWLNRKQFYLFRFMEDDYISLSFNATFTNIQREELAGAVVGLVVTMQTDKPFAYGRTIRKVFEKHDANWQVVIGCDTDEESFIYPRITLKLEADGDMIIKNNMQSYPAIVRNCTSGETIKLEYPMIQTDNTNHNVSNDFNYEWPAIVSTYRDRRNIFKGSLPCVITIEYEPIIKMGLV